jgi:hypothetical protein
VALGQFEKFTDAQVCAGIQKNSSLSVDLLAKHISLTTTDPTVTRNQPAELKDVSNAVRHGATWKAAVVAGLGGMATRSATVTEQGEVSGVYNGPNGSGQVFGTYTGTSTVTVPDNAARARAIEHANHIRTSADARSAGVIKTALVAETINPGETYCGYVYFERDKKQQAAVLQVIIGTVSFEFPLKW